jgi:hypothetical protein
VKHATTGHDLSVHYTGCDVVPIVEERDGGRGGKVTRKGVVAATGGDVLETSAVEEGEGGEDRN